VGADLFENLRIYKSQIPVVEQEIGTAGADAGHRQIARLLSGDESEDTIPFPHASLERSHIVSPDYSVCWQSLRGPSYSSGRLVSTGVGSEFRGYANQETHHTDLKQIPLWQTHRREQRPRNVKVKQASTYQRDPTDVIGNPSNQLQTNDVAHGETSWDTASEKTGRFDFHARIGQYDYIVCHRATS
jgi:hypothetical protein